MIVLSVGMPRAGSAWHYSLVHDLMKTSGSVDARRIREQYHLQKILTEVNCNIGVLSARRLAMVMVPALMGNTFVIKAHAGPSTASRMLSSLGWLRITYIYRDPRDAMLSAHEFGRRALEKGRPNAFSHLSDFHTCVEFMMEYTRIWEKWMREKHILVARYEDLLTRYDLEAGRLVEFLSLEGNRPQIQEVIGKYRPGAGEERQGLHFYKGKIGRFRESYSEDQKNVMREKLAAFLQRMGYES